jgi:hypothetical protein
MSHCTLLVPDLLGPHDAPEDVDRGLAVPSLRTALARARHETHAAIPLEGWLCQAFEVERQQDWPVAPLTLSIDVGDAGTAYWLRADPVHLELQRDRVALMGSDMLGLTQQDAEQIVAALNAQFAADGLQFDARAPRRWYVRVAQRPVLVTQTMSAAAGHDVRDVLPTGSDAPAWRQTFNEIQMVLHGLPLNEQRVDAGLPAINSIWIWGGGVKTEVPGRTFGAVWSDDALAQALGAHADAHAAPVPKDGAAWLAAARALRAEHHHLIVLNDCAQSAAYGDVGAWRNAIERLEQSWIAPLVSALRKRIIERLVIVCPGLEASHRFELGARSLSKFWVAARALSAYRS